MELAPSTYLILAFLFLAFSAFVSAVEAAFLSVRKSHIKHLAESGSRAAAEVERITRAPEKFLATVLFANNLVQSAAAAAATIAALALLRGSLGESLSGLIATIGVAILTLLLAEAIPKTFAARNPERLALLLAWPFRLIEVVLSPIASAISWLTCRITGCAIAPEYRMSEDEIRSIISTGLADGTVGPAKADLLENVFKFGDRSVRTVMTPRTEVTWLDASITLKDFLAEYAAHPHTRYPVFEDSPDDIKGMISIKDVLMAQSKHALGPDDTLKSIMRPVYLTPENKPIGELFTEMQEQGKQMAIVVDEYGGIDGIVTIAQLVEEIVGEMRDELAKGTRDYKTIDEKTFQVDGSMRIEEANEILELNLPEGDYETVAGLILYNLGRIPKQGEHLRFDGLRMTIAEMRGMKVEKVLVTKE
ncbi:MAG: HlyC/CorC family transporter [Chloroflexi bacterium]|nr:HlyC/CorC family transporter [Chloroflexota bacterium]